MSADLSSEQEGDGAETDFVEVDPTGRYGRYNEVLGKGAFKTVYKAFDEGEGIEVAWNQVKLADVLQKVGDSERLCSEVHLLKTLKHKNIIKFYSSWVDAENVNFITEVFTSGNLRQYRTKHKHVDLRALKNWSRQILCGLLYLHSHDPPVIHRDLKCDNIFVNGNQGEVKIGDLGLAAILCHAHSAHTVIGTPEFMAPELYEEEYNELVDIYAFGMCLLELVTFEYPYVECTNAAQIYKKVTSGIKPASLAKVNDPGVRKFIEKCIANASERLPASELLKDPFLQMDAEIDIFGHSIQNNPNGSDADIRILESSSSGIDCTVEGQKKDINTIFLKLRIADSTGFFCTAISIVIITGRSFDKSKLIVLLGHVHNIHFPFDIEADTSISVAAEMVSELDLTDQDVTTIADMIDTEIQVHFPNWIPGSLDEERDDETTPRKGDSKAEGGGHTFPNDPHSSGNLVLERLPSGRRYWSDSPKGSSNSSTHQTLGFNSQDNNGTERDDTFLSAREQSDDEGDDQEESPRRSIVEFKDVKEFGTESRSSHTVGPNYIEESTSPLSNGNQAEALLSNGVMKIPEKEFEVSVSALQRLEKLLIEQQNELDALRKKHELAVADTLQELPFELQCRARAFAACHMRNLNCKMQTKSD